MKIFISWSKERSRFLAEALRDWLPGVINAADPWISSNDIDPGARWGPELARQLEQTKYGILCITAENTTAPWLLFEAGALSKYVEKSRVVPLILDIKPTDIEGPLAQFQSIRAVEAEIHKLVTKINQAVFDAGEKGVDQSFLDKSFKLWWPQLKQAIESIPPEQQDIRRNERSQNEIVEEILTLVRRIDNKVIQDRVSIPTATLNDEMKEIKRRNHTLNVQKQELLTLRNIVEQLQQKLLTVEELLERAQVENRDEVSLKEYTKQLQIEKEELQDRLVQLRNKQLALEDSLST